MKVIPTFIQEAREALSMVAKTCAGHYHYDIHGNVDTLLQDNQQLSLISTALQPQRFKKIIYDYDLISGNVNLVSYQDGEPDAFYHFYEYDADNRIIAVYSSNYPQKNALININTVSSSPLWDNDAKYFYYAHGPLARVEYGDNKVQGMDYAYTLQGWIKGVNSNTLDTARDMGKDGAIGSVNSIFAKDAFGYTLNYHTNDYKAIDGLKWNTATNRFESIIAGSDLNNSRNDLFNGNITSMVTTIVPPTLPKSDSVAFSPLPQGTAYRYDQLNRLVEMKAWQNLNPITNTWGSGLAYSGMYNNKFTYDANGNILSQLRKDQSGTAINNLTYNRYSIAGRTIQNRLYSVNDSVANTAFTDDIDDQGTFNDSSLTNAETKNNYGYDEIGSLNRNNQKEIAKINYSVYGQVKEVIRTSGSAKRNLKFDYDASQNRIAKRVYTSDSVWLYTDYYVRDATGNVMSIYRHQTIDSTATVSFAQTEKNIYGSSRLGSDKTQTELIASLPVSGIYQRILDNKYYDGSNHLGNVLVTFTDRKLPIDANNDGTIDEYWAHVTSSNDYYPFGVAMKERSVNDTTNRYKFNGKEYDTETETSDFDARNQDGDIGGWNVLDKKADKYANLSPYNFVGNSPIIAIDPDGKDIIYVSGFNDDNKSKSLSAENQAQLKANYWNKPNSTAFTDDINDYFGETQETEHFVNGSDKHRLPSKASDRRAEGRKIGLELVKTGQIEVSTENNVMTIVMHSQGNAEGVGVAEGIIEGAKKANVNIKVNLVFLSVFQPGDIPLSEDMKKSGIQFTYKNDLPFVNPVKDVANANAEKKKNKQEKNDKRNGMVAAHSATIDKSDAFKEIMKTDAAKKIFTKSKNSTTEKTGLEKHKY